MTHALVHANSFKFFVRLSDLFESRRKDDHGSVFITQKRRMRTVRYHSDFRANGLPVSHGNEGVLSSNGSPETRTLDDPFADLHPASPLPVLMRATNGKSGEKVKEKVKFSSVVQPESLEAFYVRYAEVCKSGMQGLRKRDRSGRKKAKAKKRKVGAETEKR